MTQHILIRSGRLAETKEINRRLAAYDALLAAEKQVREMMYAAQGGWADILLPYAPEWTETYKEAIDILDAALARAEPNGKGSVKK